MVRSQCLGSVNAYSTTITPALRTVHGNHSLGRHSRELTEGELIGFKKVRAWVSDAEYRFALSIIMHSTPMMTAMIPIAMKIERHIWKPPGRWRRRSLLARDRQLRTHAISRNQIGDKLGTSGTTGRQAYTVHLIAFRLRSPVDDLCLRTLCDGGVQSDRADRLGGKKMSGKK